MYRLYRPSLNGFYRPGSICARRNLKERTESDATTVFDDGTVEIIEIKLEGENVKNHARLRANSNCHQ